VGLAEFLKDKESYLLLSKFLQEKRDYFVELMKETRFELLNSREVILLGLLIKEFQMSPTMNLPFGSQRFWVATIPLSAFYQDGKDDKGDSFLLREGEINLRDGR
jgi:methionine aminotransferase